ncbi:transposase [Ancylomarina sp. 16SWW S1-10-2]|uniref:ISAon1 family transposase n=1 Tax=Ancylomarina sp. 16SWW S1-10-2 TaxID=2499681 RepID=UPI0034CFC5EE
MYPNNIGPNLALDETSLSNGELYTFLTNKDKGGKKGTIVGVFKGTKADNIISLIKTHIPVELRNIVKEVTLDMAGSMNLIVKKCFLRAEATTDRFHVQQLANDAVQELRIKYRWVILKLENKAYKEAKAKGKDYKIETFENGDTIKQLMTRSRFALFKSKEKWTDAQTYRASILFERYPGIQRAYQLSDGLRKIYNQDLDPNTARLKLAHWFDEIEKAGMDSFNAIKKTFEVHHKQIVNYFISRSTNAFAESFNAKVKDFRRSLRGVVDVDFFLFRLTKIFA